LNGSGIKLASVGVFGYFYIVSTTDDEALEKGLDKSTFVKSVILAGLFLLLGCLAGSGTSQKNQLSLNSSVYAKMTTIK
jgi:hypothetical protein